MSDLTKIVIGYFGQLLVLGILGGVITLFYARLQRNRELRLQVMREFAALHGRFVALRFRMNSFYLHTGQQDHPLTTDEIRIERWKGYQEACELIGQFVGLKPLLISTFPDTSEHVEFLHSKYQEWRRRLRSNQPILQAPEGKSDEEYHRLRDAYGRSIQNMRNEI